MHPTPLHAPSVTHICSHFLRFLFIFAQPQKLPPGRCVGQCAVWGRFGCTWVWETIKALDSENRHHPGHPRAPRRTHIFPHFSEFLRIFHRRYEVDLKTHPRVCVREVFEQNPMWWGRRRSWVRGWVGSGPIRRMKVAFDSPARAECDAHLFTFLRFLFIFARSPMKSQSTQCAPGSLLLEVEIDKLPHNWNSTPAGPSPILQMRMHIFPHFSEFLLIFHRRSMSTEEPRPRRV